MPKKKTKKQSPEEKLRLFELWKESKEYQLLESLNQQLQDMSIPNEITPDLTGKWQNIIDDIMKMPAVFKIKGVKLKVKQVKQEFIRTAFFAGVNKRDEPFVIEDLELDFENKEVPKSCRHMKNNFIELLKNTTLLSNQDENTYQDWKKNKLVYKFKEFVKFLKDHLKKDKGHAETSKILDKVLNPLKTLMIANFRLSVFEKKNNTLKLKEENIFQYNALIKEFCESYQPCQHLLYTYSKQALSHNPDIYSVIKKLNYQKWQNRPAEKFFIQPLQDAFSHMRSVLLKLYSLGSNFWKQPMCENEEFLKSVQELIIQEVKTE